MQCLQPWQSGSLRPHKFYNLINLLFLASWGRFASESKGNMFLRNRWRQGSRLRAYMDVFTACFVRTCFLFVATIICTIKSASSKQLLGHQQFKLCTPYGNTIDDHLKFMQTRIIHTRCYRLHCMFFLKYNGLLGGQFFGCPLKNFRA